MLFTSLCWLVLAVEPLPLGDDSRLWVLPDGDLVIEVGPATHLTLEPRAVGGPWPGVEGVPLAVVNAGYVDATRHPIGWRVMAANITQAHSSDVVQSGIAWLDAEGRLAFAWSTDVPNAPAYALQAGPFLVDPGGTLGIRRADGPQARRTAIARTITGRRLLIIATQRWTLRAFAERILHLSDRIGCDRIDAALNLDGGPATGVTIPRYPAHQLQPVGPVADVWVLRSP